MMSTIDRLSIHIQCRVARMKFKELAGVKAVRPGKVRWFCFCEMGIQLFTHWESVMRVLDDAGQEFAVDTRSPPR